MPTRTIDFHGEALTLLPQRAIHWPRRQALIVADLHFGKSAAFRAAGVPVPEVIQADLDRLGALIDAAAARRLIIVGDLIHAPAGRTSAVLQPVERWRAARADLEITLIRGNHDHRAGDPPPAWRFDICDPPWRADSADPIAFIHDPDGHDPDMPAIGGHLHPAAVVADALSSRRAPCFWIRSTRLILPAFGRFTGSRSIAPGADDRVFIIGDDEVLELPVARASARASRAPFDRACTG